MKKISLFVALSLILFSCQKEEFSEEVSDQNTALKGSSITVTTESELKAAIADAEAGDIIKVSGTIYLTSTLQCANSGTSSSKINFYGGTLDCSGISSGWGVKVNGSYWNISYMTIKGSPDCGLVFQYGGYNWVYEVTTHDNGDSGIQVYNSAHDVSINYCTSYNNYDESNGGENADGFACKLSAGKNVKFDHCDAYYNSDDGWDLYGQPYTVKITNCTAKNHGYGTDGDGNGFKLGSSGQYVSHVVTDCVATNNIGCGYDGNGNTGPMDITGSTGSGNTKGTFCRIYE